MRIPVVNLRPSIEAARAACEQRLAEMFDRQQFILGEQVRSFEQELAASFGARFAVGCGNGTDAISLCLRHAGLGNPRQEVLTSALTAPFSGIGILAAGCAARFADVDPETLQIDPVDAGNRITRRTAGLLPVHLYGQPCDIAQFAALARGRRLTLIQDAAQAHGVSIGGKPLAAWSRYVTYSFYPTKNLGCLGDGGAILTNSAPAARALAQLRDGGRRGGQISYRGGINSRLDEMQACYLRAFLPRLADWNDDRRRTAALYDEGLGGLEGVRLTRRTAESVCHLYPIRVKKRDELRAHLAARGIGTGVHYPVPLHLQPAFRGCGLRRGDLPHAERAVKELLSLPLWPYLPHTQVWEVIDSIRAFFHR